MEGEPGTIDNFQLSMGRNDKDFVSPRHRHNFEQFRFQLEGDLDFDRDGVMKPGMVGYFPEGTYYGPQTSEGTATTFVLQFGGSSGQGYLSREEVKQSMEALRATGTFDGGVYRRNEGEPGKRNMDGFQAIWEHANGRPLQFPKARYDKPVMMDQAGYEWVPVEGATGVSEKLLGVFTERRSQSGVLRLAAGATLKGRGRSLYLCYRGTGQVDGQSLRPLTTLFLERGEQATFKADQEVEMIHFGLPDLRGLGARPSFTIAAE
jgi:hypothetical protein